MQLSKNLTLEEFCHSNTAVAKGIDNTITNPFHLESAKLWAEKVFQPIREHLGRPLKINSGYRGKKLNASIAGSSKTSQHCVGQAGDLDITDGETFEWIRKNIEFDQLIKEQPTADGGQKWIHISYVKTGNRKQVLKMEKKGGKSVYTAI